MTFGSLTGEHRNQTRDHPQHVRLVLPVQLQDDKPLVAYRDGVMARFPEKFGDLTRLSSTTDTMIRVSLMQGLP